MQRKNKKDKELLNEIVKKQERDKKKPYQLTEITLCFEINNSKYTEPVLIPIPITKQQSQELKNKIKC